MQIVYQLADSAAGFAYSFLGTCLILLLINFIPGLYLRATEEDEIMGMDDTEIGEFAVSPPSRSLFTYWCSDLCQYDYVELLRDVVHGVEDDTSSALPMLSMSLSREKHIYTSDGSRPYRAIELEGEPVRHSE